MILLLALVLVNVIPVCQVVLIRVAVAIARRTYRRLLLRSTNPR
jgi:hypothetical protein